MSKAGRENNFCHPRVTAAEFLKPHQDAFIMSKCFFFFYILGNIHSEIVEKVNTCLLKAAAG